MPTDMATVNTQRCGTAVYAPIEMVMEGKVSPTADVYSLAMIVGEMLSGRLLHQDISMAQAVVAVVHRGMRPELGDWVPAGLRCAYLPPSVAVDSRFILFACTRLRQAVSVITPVALNTKWHRNLSSMLPCQLSSSK